MNKRKQTLKQTLIKTLIMMLLFVLMTLVMFLVNHYCFHEEPLLVQSVASGIVALTFLSVFMRVINGK